MRILIIDDERSYYEAIESAWSREHVVDYARSIESLQGRDQKQMRAYDVIVCDNDFDADLDAGLRIISYLRSVAKFQNRIILHTRNPRSYFKGECDIKKLDVDYVQKPVPYSSAALMEALAR